MMEEVLGTGGQGAGNIRAPSWGTATEERDSHPGSGEGGFQVAEFLRKPGPVGRDGVGVGGGGGWEKGRCHCVLPVLGCPNPAEGSPRLPAPGR